MLVDGSIGYCLRCILPFSFPTLITVLSAAHLAVVKSPLPAMPTLNNNGSTKFANWVAYKITKETPASNRPRNWKTDPEVPAGETLNPVDYNGARVALDLDRGHQANLASMGGMC